MDAPQSRDEIDPIETAIRREIDDLLRIRWNPRSYVTRPGAYDAYGRPISPSYEGRWEVVRPLESELAVIYQVRWDGEGGEAYRAVGWWLLDFLRTWDRANQHWIAEMQRLLDAEAALVRDADERDEHEAREQWDRTARETLHMEHWIGRGFGTPASRSTDDAPAAPDASESSQPAESLA